MPQTFLLKRVGLLAVQPYSACLNFYQPGFIHRPDLIEHNLPLLALKLTAHAHQRLDLAPLEKRQTV